MERIGEIEYLIEQAKAISDSIQRSEVELLSVIGDNNNAISQFENYKDNQAQMSLIWHKLSTIQNRQINTALNAANVACDIAEEMKMDSELQKMVIEELEGVLILQTAKLGYLKELN